MFSLRTDPAYSAFTVRPVNKATDRFVVREIFRQEFYGDHFPAYPDEGLWEIYDRMDANDAFGAYLVCQGEQVLFLLEIHPPIQMDLNADNFTGPDTIGIYCFLHSRNETICLPAFRACISSLLHQSGIHRILTSHNKTAGQDPRSGLLEKSGFRPVPDASKKLAVYSCTPGSFGREKHLFGNIIFSAPSSFTE